MSSILFTAMLYGVLNPIHLFAQVTVMMAGAITPIMFLLTFRDLLKPYPTLINLFMFDTDHKNIT